ncbi:ubiquinone biosynthesis accessory factor UbiJ [Polynucleobacter nymphae]|jgi:ubiquinone biosynthesis accessory factor UbiJ|uniref:ubiquinone biosynthesis accessory factor UbiJ n=1 Tax=Polynucleobacter nymphae TaxID=2081043 RepID=UPI001C0B543C|nr:SCP2 sterol-binding domain-containing protein [Polynucleobacter nymphae]MBU3608330.1 SCP2 sterol-binding domain-containing protein [Polynucleobacter nymphae]
MNTHLSSTHTIAAGATCRGINHVLGSEPWASTALAKHAGKTILLELPLGNLCFEISSAGLLNVLKEAQNPSLTLEVSSKALGELAASSGSLREQAFKAVKLTGDADLAQLIGRLAGQLRWEYEEDLARLVGDAPANFAVRQGKKFISASRSAASDLLDNVVEYVSEERKVLLNKRDFIAHKSELNDLRESVDRIEKRIQLLEQKVR